jgi:hypothetical protein
LIRFGSDAGDWNRVVDRSSGNRRQLDEIEVRRQIEGGDVERASQEEERVIRAPRGERVGDAEGDPQMAKTRAVVAVEQDAARRGAIVAM